MFVFTILIYSSVLRKYNLQKIKELIEVLDQRKDESIERTFKGVARNFREVFSELVQGGHGFLVMMKKKVSRYLDFGSSFLCINGVIVRSMTWTL